MTQTRSAVANRVGALTLSKLFSYALFVSSLSKKNDMVSFRFIIIFKSMQPFLVSMKNGEHALLLSEEIIIWLPLKW
jgi:hypothetical protein